VKGLDLDFISIGTVISGADDTVDENWGSVTSEIHLSDDFSKGLKGLESFSHALIIFFMHQAGFDSETDLIRRPRGRKDLPEMGIFAQRAKHRPNPIGITAVKIINLTENVLTVIGLDAVNGTPVLDIKPYFPVFDRVDNAVTPGWVDEIMKDYF
jgi:tRNA-Thr(GGU) m(6)t(6)A37 methyltransferase TsaA